MRTLMSVPGATVSVTFTGLGFSATLGAALEPDGAAGVAEDVGLDDEAVGAPDASLGVVLDGAARCGALRWSVGSRLRAFAASDDREQK